MTLTSMGLKLRVTKKVHALAGVVVYTELVEEAQEVRLVSKFAGLTRYPGSAQAGANVDAESCASHMLPGNPGT